MKNRTNLGDTLYSFRKKAHLSQEELAEKLEVSRQSISKWECGESLPDTENLIALAELYGVTLDKLVHSTTNDTTPRKVENFEIDERQEQTISIRIAQTLKLLPYPILILIAFLLWGFIWDGWSIAWTLFLTIPIYYSIAQCFKTSNLKHFNYPFLITFIYLFCGMQWKWWHPHWVLFLTIPVYFAVIKCIERLR